MSWAVDEKIWNPILEVDARFLSTETAGGFVGCVIGLYATSLGKQSHNKAHFKWFEYRGKDGLISQANGNRLK